MVPVTSAPLPSQHLTKGLWNTSLMCLNKGINQWCPSMKPWRYGDVHWTSHKPKKDHTPNGFAAEMCGHWKQVESTCLAFRVSTCWNVSPSNATVLCFDVDAHHVLLFQAPDNLTKYHDNSIKSSPVPCSTSRNWSVVLFLLQECFGCPNISSSVLVGIGMPQSPTKMVAWWIFTVYYIVGKYTSRMDPMRYGNNQMFLTKSNPDIQTIPFFGLKSQSLLCF